MQFSQVAPSEASANTGTKATLSFHAITVSQNFVSRCVGLLPTFTHMHRDSTSQQSKMTGIVAKVAIKLVSGIRLMARFASCYVQTRRERNQLSRLSYRSLRDIGLTNMMLKKSCGDRSCTDADVP